MTTPSGPLKGLRVIDLTRVLAGYGLGCEQPHTQFPKLNAQPFVPRARH